MARISWDKYETALLINSYWEIENGIVSEKEAVCMLSKQLRQRAINNNNLIDEKFRNENGIRLRLAELKTIFSNGNKGLTKEPSKLFKEIADLYINSYEEFEKLLEEATLLESTNSKENIKDMFFSWSNDNIPASDRYFLADAIGIIDEFCVRTKIYSNTLLEETDLVVINLAKDAINRNKIFKFRYRKHIRKCIDAINYYSKFIKEFYSVQNKSTNNEAITQSDSVEQIEDVMEEILMVDFENPNSFFQTIPESLSYFDEIIPLEKQSWSYLYGKLSQVLYEDYPGILKSLIGTRLANCGKVDFYGSISEKITEPVEIAPRLYLETYTSSNDIINKIKALLDKCRVDYENVVITYKPISKKEKTEIFYTKTLVFEGESKPKNKKEIKKQKNTTKVTNTPVVEKEHKVSLEAEPVTEDKTLEIDFENIPELSFTTPVLLKFKDGYEIKDPSSWTHLYVGAVMHIYYLAPKILQNYAGRNINNGNRADFGYKAMSSKMKAPKPINDHFYVETNLSSGDIVKKIKTILELCHMDYSFLTIKYRKKGTVSSTPSVKSSPSRSKNKYVEEFKQWMINQHISLNTAINYASGINSCENFMLEHSIGTGRLYGADKEEISSNVELLKDDSRFLEYNDNQHNRFTAALSKFTQFSNISIEIKPPRKPQAPRQIKQVEPELSKPKYDDLTIRQYSKILIEKFAKGYRFDIMSRKQFARAYVSEFGKEIADLEKIDDIVKTICFVCNNRAYHPDAVIDKAVKNKIVDYIKSTLGSEASAIYIEPLYETFEDELLYSGLSSVEMFKAYIRCIVDNNFYVFENYIANKADFVPSVREEVCEYMRTSGPLTKDEIYQNLSHLPKDKIDNAISNEEQIVLVAKQTYCHIEFFNFSNDILSEIRNIINDFINQKGYVTSKELNESIRAKLPYFFEENEVLTKDYSLRNVLSWYFKKDFTFDTVISSKNNHYSIDKIFKEFCESHSAFTINDLGSLARELNVNIYFDSVCDKSTRISEKQFVTDDSIEFDTTRIDECIESFMYDDYITIKDINLFGTFPETHFPWNKYLLESYVYKYSQKVKLVHDRFNATVAIGAIVKKSAAFNSYHDIIIDALAKSDIELTKDNAYDYLCMRGFLSCYQYKKIDDAVEKAINLRKRL